MNSKIVLPFLCGSFALATFVNSSLAFAQATAPVDSAPAPVATTPAASAPSPNSETPRAAETPPQATDASAAVSESTTATQAAPAPVETSERASLSGTFSLLGGIGYSYGFATAFGVGLRGQFAIVPKGFLHSLKAPMHDELTLEPGLDYFRVGYGNGVVETLYSEFTPLVGVAWNFWITDQFVVYPKIDIGLRIGSSTSSVYGVNGTTYVNASLYFQGAAGAAYRFGPVAVRAEVGWQAFRAGVGIDLF